MAGPRLTNYLLSHRKSCGLSQTEVAFLLGCKSSSKIAAYERRNREPDLRTLLAFEMIYEAPIEELFAGLYEEVRQDLARRKRLLAQRWQAQAPPEPEAPRAGQTRSQRISKS